MCGICGEIRFDQQASSLASLEAMMAKLIPRGPDAGGIVQHQRVSLGHRRLKIIDLSEQARQPMVDATLGLDAVFNGCIYNYRQLRKELEEVGYRFFSSGDTEVILKGYHAWGIDCVKKMNGMFAFVIHERDTGRVIMARDRLGIKPLYTTHVNGGCRFASTLPALLAAGDVDTTIDPVALHHYFHWHSVVPAPLTILKGIRKLPPATLRIYEPDGRYEDTTYWRLSMHKHRAYRDRSPDQWIDALSEGLAKAVERRMVADVPVGVLLSGGVDSSFLVGLLAEQGQRGLSTFSVGFEGAGGERGDEFYYSDIIADHYQTDHHQIFVPSSQLLATLPHTIQAMSEPMVSYDAVGFYLLSQEVSKHVKVVQSGQGADEVFGGYHWYPPLYGSGSPAEDYRDVFFDLAPGQMQEVVTDGLISTDYSMAFVRDYFKQLDTDHPVEQALALDTTVMLTDDPVKRVDNMTMAWGLEARVPFLDHELVELAAQIPVELKVRGEGKWVLKEAARRLLPKQVIDREKGYFPVPALKHIQGPYLEYVREYLTNETATQRKLFNSSHIETLLNDPTGHITNLRGSRLWQSALLEMWLQQQGI